MKKVWVIYLLCILSGAHQSASGQTMSKCFRADWLQGERVVKLAIEGNSVTGTFSVGDGGGAAPSKTYNFSGTRRGNLLSVVFEDNKLPEVAPSEMKSLVWTLVQARGKESLRIKFSGKNYETNKHQENFADFESCAANSSDAAAGHAKGTYADLVKTAQTIRFTRGATSASVRLDARAGFQAMREPATFLINAARAQTLEIKAEGCTIEIYLPNRKLHSYVEWEGAGEKTFANSQLDRMSIESLPASGNYLVVLRKPNANMLPETLTITVRN